MNVEAAIFDLDGTLIDSVPAYLKMLEIILEKVHLPPVPRETISTLMRGGGEGWKLLIPEEMKDREDELRPKILAVANEVGRKIFPKEVRLFSGVPEIFYELSSKKIKIGLVTSSHARAIEAKLLPLKEHGIDELIDEVISIDDVHKIKPAPEPLIECAWRMNVNRGKSVYVGDSYVDLRAGRSAGMMTVGVLTGMDDYETLKNEDPDLIVAKIGDLRNIFNQVLE